MTIQRRSRSMIAALAVAGGLAILPAGQASGHVHGITPLNCVGAENAGAIQTDGTPAASRNGGPIGGLIPRDVGSSPLDVGDGGFHTPACPNEP